MTTREASRGDEPEEGQVQPEQQRNRATERIESTGQNNDDSRMEETKKDDRP